MSTETIAPKIIQRPAGSIQLKKRPVEEKVSPRRSGDDTSGGAVKVLAKATNHSAPPSTANNESCSNHVEKEEKNDDPKVTMTDTVVNNTDGSATEISTAAVDEWNPLEEVDSALLTALCDAKERKALVRLESILVDFMKDPSLPSIDVGGAFNSIVVGLRPQQQTAEEQTPTTSASGGGVTTEEDATTTTFVPSQSQGVQDLLSQYQRGIRQTSFQRLILHRLADRFNIVREQINNINPNPAPVTNSDRNTGERGLVDVGANNNNYINNSWAPQQQQQQQNSYPLGLIRLIKHEESCIPAHLLINLDLSLLVNYKNPRARNFVPSNNNNNNNNAEEGMRTLSDNMNAASLDNAAGASMPGPKKPNKKMVIMKRNSSSNTAGSGEGSGNGKREGRSRRKKLEDREKAYEEARARIFGKEEKKDTEGIAEDRGESAAAAVQDNLSPLNSCHSSFSAEETNEAPPTDSESADVSNGGSHIVPSQLISKTTPKIRSASPSPEPPPVNTVSGSVVETEGEQKQQGQSKTKAVYRNRQQEENDPDFRRRSAYVPAAAMGVTSSGHMSGVPYNMVNPYAVNPYSAVPGQHVMMQQQPPHFYPHPGQVTPQDPKSVHYPGYTQPRVFYPAQQPQQQPQSKPRSIEQQAQPSVVVPRKTNDSSQGAPQARTVPQVNDARPPPPKPTWGPNARLEIKPSEPAAPTKNVAPTKKAAPAKITTPPPPAKNEKREIKTTLYKDEDFPALG